MVTSKIAATWITSFVLIVDVGIDFGSHVAEFEKALKFHYKR